MQFYLRHQLGGSFINNMSQRKALSNNIGIIDGNLMLGIINLSRNNFHFLLF